jgi:hypothetical protein
MWTFPALSILVVPRGCDTPPPDEAPAEAPAVEAPPVYRSMLQFGELLRVRGEAATLPLAAGEDPAVLDGMRAEVAAWSNEDCDPCFVRGCGGSELSVIEGGSTRTIRLTDRLEVASAPVWLDRDRIAVGIEGWHSELVVVERSPDGWRSRWVLGIEGAWIEPVRVVDGTLVLRLTAGRFRWDDPETGAGTEVWRALRPAELRRMVAEADPEPNWTGAFASRLYRFDLDGDGPAASRLSPVRPAP